jgi:hypothetical protein
MSILSINKNLELSFLGRNGYAHMCGVSVIAFQSLRALHIEPITSRGLVGRCSIQIPVAQLDDFIAALRSEAADVALPRSERSLTPTQLRSQFGEWGQHPEFPRSDWQYEVGNGDTQRGYWDFVAAKLDEAKSNEAGAESGNSQSPGGNVL